MGDRQARIERVADEARAHRAVIHLEVMLRVPGQRGDAVAEREPQRRQRARQAIAARPQRGVADAARARAVTTSRFPDHLAAWSRNLSTVRA